MYRRFTTSFLIGWEIYLNYIVSRKGWLLNVSNFQFFQENRKLKYKTEILLHIHLFLREREEFTEMLHV